MRVLAILGTVFWLIYTIYMISTNGWIVQHDEGISALLLLLFLIINIVALISFDPKHGKGDDAE